ncbi:MULTISPECIES: metalloregulator ArsR/SmtB family transcription factor [unclassified Leucobacter]|uniref:ArsR/SmtB family transcription factor n=1 Tax=unclassified Leucobacter TaxID=2621730 RepID=UPI00165E1FA3|nr:MULTISPECIES: metalloregulator ArsR/SmtB family transcription factor [unclassified Leucobacter]MBC9927057.1 winged helix-turn-helix transcriptional regulator [Leucobacter sp. cx-169]MBC9936335.1 winged helix-turn-helix transcriptional regulator [Leucobacter sp. cx-87]
MYADNEELVNGSIPVAVEIFSLLADATRVRLILALEDGERSVGELAEVVGKPQATVSQHLAKLRMSRIVVTRQEGVRVYYRLAGEHAIELVRVALYQAEHAVGAEVRHPHPAQHAAALTEAG